MRYTDEFKYLVRELYGNTFDKELESGDSRLGRSLSTNSPVAINVDRILESESLEALKKEAIWLKKKDAIYQMYWKQPV